MDPGRLIAGRLARRGDHVRIGLDDAVVRRLAARIRVVGAGKAAASMARAVATILPEASGVVVAPRSAVPGGSRRAGRIRILPGDHPVPGRASFDSTATLLEALARFPRDATVLCLLSGGASALFAASAPGLSRADKAALTRYLLRCGAPIEAMNAVRKHVSAVKGGRLALRAAPREVFTLALSDVPGDDLATIGSGPTVADPTSFRDALRLLRRAEAGELPARILDHLTAGAAGRLEETPGPDDPRLRRSRAVVIGCNDTACVAAAAAAESLGYVVRPGRQTLTGEAADRARRFVRALPRDPRRPTCVLAGGETFVTATGSSGRGGRCQEMAVAAAEEVAGSGWTILFAGTDGRDGPTDAAGGFVDGTSLARAGRRLIARALREHDAHPLLRGLGDLLRTGPTGTNVMDLAIALHPGRSLPVAGR